jgi:hypothetical protein
VQQAISQGLSESGAMKSSSPPRGLLRVPFFAPPSIKRQLAPLNDQMHRLNIMSAYRKLRG